MRIQDYKNLLTVKLQDMERHRAPTEGLVIARSAEMMDEIQQAAQRDMEMTTRALSWKTTIAVHAALDRVAAGSFGLCRSCDEPINERRLNALPWAGQCIACQHTEENQLLLASAA